MWHRKRSRRGFVKLLFFFKLNLGHFRQFPARPWMQAFFLVRRSLLFLMDLHHILSHTRAIWKIPRSLMIHDKRRFSCGRSMGESILTHVDELVSTELRTESLMTEASMISIHSFLLLLNLLLFRRVHFLLPYSWNWGLSHTVIHGLRVAKHRTTSTACFP